MKMITPMLFTVLATMALSRISSAGQYSMDTFLAAERMAQVAKEVQTLVEVRPELAAVVWDAQRLTQAAERFPALVGVGHDFFNVERKFQRISKLALGVREGLIDSLTGEGCAGTSESPVITDPETGPDAEVLAAIENLEVAYLDLASALYDSAPEPDIGEGRAR